MNRQDSEEVMFFDEENVEYDDVYMGTIDENDEFVDDAYRQPIHAHWMEEEVAPSPTPSTSEAHLQEQPKKKMTGPPTSYNLFFKDKVAEARRENPQMGGKEMLFYMSAVWRKLPVNERRSYEREAVSQRQKFREENPGYRRASRAPTATKAPRAPRTRRDPLATLASLASIATIVPVAPIAPITPVAENPVPHEVKRPLNAFMMYVNFRRNNLREGDSELKLVERTKRYGEEWKALTDEEKKPYVEEAKRLAEEHQLNHPNYWANRRLAMKRTRDEAKAESATVEPPAKKTARGRNLLDLQNIQPTFFTSNDFPWNEVYKTLGLDPKDLL